MSETRIPTQKRSIDKRNRIIEKGFELMCKQGYHKTNTSDIAEYAGVSTGIIYQYFNDKKEIFIEGIKNYSDSIMFPILDLINNNEISFNNIEELLSVIIDMSHLNEKTAEIIHQKEVEVTKKIVDVLKSNNITPNHLYEKVHIIMNLIDNICHEVVYHNHKSIDYSIMKQEVIKAIINILKNE